MGSKLSSLFCFVVWKDKNLNTFQTCESRCNLVRQNGTETESTLVCFITTHQQSLGQGNIFISVCHSVHRGGVPDQVHPRDQVHPPGPGTPPGTRYPHPQTRYTPWDQVPPPGPGTLPPEPGAPLGPGTPSRTRQVPPMTRYPHDQIHPPGTR